MTNEISFYPADRYADYRAFLTGIREKYSDKPALTWFTRKGEEKSLSYAAFAEAALSFGEALLADGIAGAHIGVAGENSAEWLIACFGIIASGSVAVLVDIEQPASIIESMLKETDVSLLIASPSVLSLLADEAPDCPLRNSAISMSGIGDRTVSALCEQGRASLAPDSLIFRAEEKPDSTAVIAFTSGTTSAAKPVMLSRRGLLENAAGSISMVRPSPRVFSSLPFYHTYGLTCGATCILLAGSHLGINGDMKTVSRDLARFDPEILMAVPLIVEMLHKKLWAGIEKTGRKGRVQRLIKLFLAELRLGRRTPFSSLSDVRSKAFGSLTTIVCGGAHLAPRLASELLGFGILVLEGYGITECSPLVSVNRKAAFCLSSAGRVLPGFSVRSAADGEILVQGPCVMLGYYNMPEATEAAMEDGWFHTGDLGEIDKNGFLHITGRKKNLIVLKNGKKIAPEEIERYLRHIPMVKEAVAYGAASGNSTDDVKLAVSVYPDPAYTEGMNTYEILERLQREIDSLNLRLPTYKQIQMTSLRAHEFSRTASGKIKRQEG